MLRIALVLVMGLVCSTARTAQGQNRITRRRPSYSLPTRGYGFDWYQGRPGRWQGNAVYRTFRPRYPLYQSRGTTTNTFRRDRRRGG